MSVARSCVFLSSLFALLCACTASNNTTGSSGGGYGSGKPGECGLPGGSTPAFYSCSSPADCVEGTVCVDNGSDGHYYCRPLCTSTADCQKYPYADLSCNPLLCDTGTATASGLSVCGVSSHLASSYDGSSCCGGSASAGAGGNCGSTAAIQNTPAQAIAGSQETPGQYAYTCPGHYVAGSAAPGPNCGMYCATGANVCCAPQGHPELSCAPGSHCTSDGHCTSGQGCASKPTGFGDSCTTQQECAAKNPALLCGNGKCVVREGGTCADSSWCYPGTSCNGGQCLQTAPASGTGGMGGTTSSGGTSCSTHCGSICTNQVPEQACYYCQAACLCACSGDTACAQQNRSSAQSLGTTCPQ